MTRILNEEYPSNYDVFEAEWSLATLDNRGRAVRDCLCNEIFVCLEGVPAIGVASDVLVERRG